jgi:ferredoxin
VREFDVRFTQSEKVVRVRADESILEAGLGAGVRLQSDCRKGICKTCMVRVKGLVDQTYAFTISDDELAQGFALICVGRPRGNLEIDA